MTLPHGWMLRRSSRRCFRWVENKALPVGWMVRRLPRRCIGWVEDKALPAGWMVRRSSRRFWLGGGQGSACWMDGEKIFTMLFRLGGGQGSACWMDGEKIFRTLYWLGGGQDYSCCMDGEAQKPGLGEVSKYKKVTPGAQLHYYSCLSYYSYSCPSHSSCVLCHYRPSSCCYFQSLVAGCSEYLHWLLLPERLLGSLHGKQVLIRLEQTSHHQPTKTV